MSSQSFRRFSTANVVLAAGTIAAALMASSQASADPVYKWKDARGNSEYSQQPPPKGVKFEIVQITTDTHTASGTADANAKGHPANDPAKANANADKINTNPDKPGKF